MQSEGTTFVVVIEDREMLRIESVVEGGKRLLGSSNRPVVEKKRSLRLKTMTKPQIDETDTAMIQDTWNIIHSFIYTKVEDID